MKDVCWGVPSENLEYLMAPAANIMTDFSSSILVHQSHHRQNLSNQVGLFSHPDL